MARPLGPNEGMNALRHEDCRFCDEYERLVRGRDVEIKALKTKLAELGEGSNERPPGVTSPPSQGASNGTAEPKADGHPLGHAIEELMGRQH